MRYLILNLQYCVVLKWTRHVAPNFLPWNTFVPTLIISQYPLNGIHDRNIVPVMITIIITDESSLTAAWTEVSRLHRFISINVLFPFDPARAGLPASWLGTGTLKIIRLAMPWVARNGDSWGESYQWLRLSRGYWSGPGLRVDSDVVTRARPGGVRQLPGSTVITWPCRPTCRVSAICNFVFRPQVDSDPDFLLLRMLWAKFEQISTKPAIRTTGPYEEEQQARKENAMCPIVLYNCEAGNTDVVIHRNDNSKRFHQIQNRVASSDCIIIHQLTGIPSDILKIGNRWLSDSIKEDHGYSTHQISISCNTPTLVS